MRKLTFIAAAVSVALLGGCQQMQEQPKPAPSVQSQPVQSGQQCPFPDPALDQRATPGIQSPGHEYPLPGAGLAGVLQSAGFSARNLCRHNPVQGHLLQGRQLAVRRQDCGPGKI